MAMETGTRVFLEGGGLTLSEALGVARGDVIAFVGAGGKTTAMFRLATELAGHGSRVLVTTTTHIFPPDVHQFPSLVLADNLQRLLTETSAALQSHPVVVAARELNGDGKLTGIDPDWVLRLRDELPISNVLVEADGSKGRPLKAPAAHEPVIPSSANLVIPVIGLSVLGRPLSNEAVHRPELVARLAGVQLWTPISPAIVAAVLTHAEGVTRGAPAGARVIPLLNQADDLEHLEAGREVACDLIANGIDRVLLTALQQPEAVREIAWNLQSGAEANEVSAIVLAAGRSRRMGRLKQGLPLGGKSFLRRVVDGALASRVQEVVVVLGYGATELEPQLPENPRLRVVYNSHHAQGQSWSVKVGLHALKAGIAGAIFLLADQPLIEPEAVNAVLHAFQASHAPIAQPVYHGEAGNPVLFARVLFPELLQIEGDQGGRGVMARHSSEILAVNLDLDIPRDVDTAQDYENLVNTFMDDRMRN